MQITSTIHNHCTLCDGRSTAEQMCNAAIDAGFTDFGMSCHGYAPFDLTYSVPGEEIYLEEMEKIKRKFAGKLRINTGIEEDFFAPSHMPEAYDYIIGDVHYTENRQTGEKIDIDGRPANFLRVRDELFHGSAMDVIRDYYTNMVHAAEKHPAVLGHFDLIVKNNAGNILFDEECDEYLKISEEAIRACAAEKVIFEVNTGAYVRGIRDTPYPRFHLLQILADLGAKITLSADCHYAPAITAGLDDAVRYIKKAGFSTVYMWENSTFVEKSIV